MKVARYFAERPFSFELYTKRPNETKILPRSDLPSVMLSSLTSLRLETQIIH